MKVNLILIQLINITQTQMIMTLRLKLESRHGVIEYYFAEIHNPKEI
jgi:hypothetical protein